MVFAGWLAIIVEDDFIRSLGCHFASTHRQLGIPGLRGREPQSGVVADFILGIPGNEVSGREANWPASPSASHQERYFSLQPRKFAFLVSSFERILRWHGHHQFLMLRDPQIVSRRRRIWLQITLCRKRQHKPHEL